MNTATTFSTGLSSQDRLQRLIHSFFGSLEAQDVHLRSLSSTRMDPTSSPRQLTAPSSLTPTHGTVLPTCSMLTSQSELDSPREVSTMSRVRRASLKTWPLCSEVSLSRTQNTKVVTSSSPERATLDTTCQPLPTSSSTMPRTSSSTSRVSLSETDSLTHSHNTQPTPNSPTRTT